jgi:hypothetical protein
MTINVRNQEIGMLLRVLATYAAWLTVSFSNISPFISVFIVIASPMFFGSVIWHLWKIHSLSAVNQIAFCGALAFFPFLAIQLFAVIYLG